MTKDVRIVNEREQVALGTADNRGKSLNNGPQLKGGSLPRKRTFKNSKLPRPTDTIPLLCRLVCRARIWT